MFYQHYINIVKNSPGKGPNCLENSLNPDSDEATALEIRKRYAKHPSRDVNLS